MNNCFAFIFLQACSFLFFICCFAELIAKTALYLKFVLFHHQVLHIWRSCILIDLRVNMSDSTSWMFLLWALFNISLIIMPFPIFLAPFVFWHFIGVLVQMTLISLLTRLYSLIKRKIRFMIIFLLFRV